MIVLGSPVEFIDRPNYKLKYPLDNIMLSISKQFRRYIWRKIWNFAIKIYEKINIDCNNQK